MTKNKLLDIIGVLLLFIGFLLAFLPHAFHTSIGLNDSVSHTKHIVAGIAFVLAALVVLVYNNGALRKIF